MADILVFNSGSKIVLIDTKMFLTYGREGDGVFLVSFEDLYKNLFLNEDTFIDTASDENGLITVTRLKDYDGEILMAVNKIPSYRKTNNIYSVTFDAYESLVIRSVAVSLMS